MAKHAAILRFGMGAALTVAAAVAAAFAQNYGPPVSGADRPFRAVAEHGGPPDAAAVDRSRLSAAVRRLVPQRPGVVDAYVIVAALDGDPVFGREAREAARVFAERYDAAGRTLLLAGPDGRSIDPLPHGSPDTLGAAIMQVAKMMNPNEDALILYVTAHGSPAGVVYRDQGAALANVPPAWLDDVLRLSGVRNRLVIISACFSGVFVPIIASREGAVITAAAANRTSFGCASQNDWTFFGDAFVNHALRKSQPLAAAFAEARTLVGKWEAGGRLIPSNPQIAIGAQAASWLRPLEARMPKVMSAPVGRPATDAIDQAIAANH